MPAVAYVFDVVGDVIGVLVLPSLHSKVYNTMPTSSDDVLASTAQVKPVQLTVKRATGAWLVPAETVTTLLLMFVSPPPSLAWREIVYVPADANVFDVVGTENVGRGLPSLQSQVYATTPTSSVDVLPSTLHVSPVQLTVNRDTGAWLAPLATVTLDVFVLVPFASVTVSVTEYVPDDAYVWLTVTPLPVVASPNVQLYVAAGRAVEVLPSKLHDSTLHDEVKFATGGGFVRNPV